MRFCIELASRRFIIILLYAFTTDESAYTFPPPGLTTRWWAVAWGRQDFWHALGLSLRVALVATSVALVMGTLAAAAVSRTRFFGRESISFLLILPIALPGIVTGIALRAAIGAGNIPFSFWTIVIGHATFCVVVVYNNVLARLRRFGSSLIEASMDLGANGFQSFRHVVLPHLSTALLAGGMLAFALSFDEVIVTTFTAGQQQKMLDAWCAYMDACDACETDPHAFSTIQLQTLADIALAADAGFYAAQALVATSLEECTCGPRTELSCPPCCARHALTGDEMPY